MGYLLKNMHVNIVDEQRDVVKNEMRQRYLNTPYNKAFMEIPKLMYPSDHPYSWPVIGSMDDLTAASFEDVVHFFRTHYIPNNASLAIVGDIHKIDGVKRLVEHWFSDVPKGVKQAPPSYDKKVELPGVIKKTLTDHVDLPRRFILWHTPAGYQPGDAALDVLATILTSTKNSRLYKRLMYDKQYVQSVEATQMSQDLGSMYMIDFLASPGYTLDEIQAIVDEEIERISKEPPTQQEIDLAVNGLEYNFYSLMEKNANVANYLNRYYYTVGKANYFKEDIARYKAVTPEEVSRCARQYLLKDKRLELSIVPEPKDAKNPDSQAPTADKAADTNDSPAKVEGAAATPEATATVAPAEGAVVKAATNEETKASTNAVTATEAATADKANPAPAVAEEKK